MSRTEVSPAESGASGEHRAPALVAVMNPFKAMASGNSMQCAKGMLIVLVLLVLVYMLFRSSIDGALEVKDSLLSKWADKHELPDLSKLLPKLCPA